MMRNHLPPSGLPGLSLAILRVLGARRPGYRSHDVVLAGWAKLCDFVARGRRSLQQLPATQANASSRPRVFPYAVAIGIDHQASPLEVETTETVVSDFFGGAAALGGLRLPPPSLRSWKTTKKAKQQSTTGRRRVGGILEVQGVMEVTPYARIRNLVTWRRGLLKTAASPPSGSTKDQKKLKQQSTCRMGRVRGAEDCRGARK